MSPTVLLWHRNAVDGNRTALDLDLDGSGWIQKSVIFYPSGPAGPADLVRPQYGCSERSNLAPKDSQGHL